MKNAKVIGRNLCIAVCVLILMGFLSSQREANGAELGYIDTHNHAPTNPTCDYDDANGDGTPDNIYDGKVQTDVIANMNLYDIAITLFMPPPHGVDNKPSCNYQHLSEIVKKYPERFAMLLGGETLNVMIQRMVKEDAIFEFVAPEFKNRALEILNVGARGFGEMAAEHFSFHAGHPYISAPPDHPLFLLLAEIAAEHDVPIDLHMEAISQDIDRTQPGAIVCEIAPDVCRATENPNPEIFKENITAFKNLLNHNLNAKIIWVHAAWDNTGDRIVELMSQLLDAHPNLYIQLRPLRGEGRIMGCKTSEGVTTCKIRDEWVTFIKTYPDRLLIGLDSFYSKFKDDLADDFFVELLNIGKDFLDKLYEQLPAEVADKVAFENAVQIYKLGGQIQFSSASYGVDEGVGEATITVERTGYTIGSVTVDFATSDGTAIGDFQPDYVPTSGTRFFAAGETTKTFTVSIVNDPAVEDNETVNLTLSNPTGGATLGTQDTAVLTIANNDVAFRFKDATYSVSEGEVTGLATIRVEKLGGTPETVTVNYTTGGGTAIAGTDYDAATATGTLIFAPGDPGIKTFSVTILNNDVLDGDRTLILTLTSATNPRGDAAIDSPGTAVLTILNDDVAFRFSSASYSVPESGVAIIEVQRLGNTTGTASVSFATSDGAPSFTTSPATAGSDYVAASVTLSFGPGGETSKTFGVSIVPDTIPERHETVNLTLSNPFNSNGGSMLATPNTAVLTILNDDVAFRFSTDSYSVTESAGPAIIEVKRLGETEGTVSVDFGTGGGTATAGADYTTTSGKLIFGPGDMAKTFPVTILDDMGPEDHETVNLGLSNPFNPSGTAALVATSETAVLTILNDDVVFRFSQGAYVVGEGTDLEATIAVRRIGDIPPLTSSSVDYATRGSTATAGTDYTTTSGTLVFGSGVKTQTFTVPILNDGVAEGIEMFILGLSNPINNATTTGSTARLGEPDMAEVIIQDDD